MRLAARALLAGVADPVGDYLALDEDDFVIATAVVNKAIELRNDAEKKAAGK